MKRGFGGGFSKGVKGIFVTGTDTGVGKTLATGALAKVLQGRGVNVGVFKPIATGCEAADGKRVSGDGRFLSYCVGGRLSAEAICPVRYEEPVAPVVAAQKSGRAIDWEKIVESYNGMAGEHERMIVEGIGGVMVPLERDTLVLDLMGALGLEVLIVGRSGLGTINHTLMTIEVCRGRGLRVAGVVLNEGLGGDKKGDVSEADNAGVIEAFGEVRVLCVFPYDTSSCVETCRLGEGVLSAVRRLDNCLDW